MAISIKGDPYDFPYDGNLRPEKTAFVIVDMQVDYLQPGGYFDAMGYDIAPMRAAIEPTRRALAAAREAGLHVIFVREGYRADLADLPDVVRWRSKRVGAEIGGPGPYGRFMIRGEKGAEITPELRPLPGEPIIDKSATNGFYATDLDFVLTHRGISSMVFAGITTDVCVHSTLRAAADRGYDCMLLRDCTAATLHENYLASLSMIQQEGGFFGTIGSSADFVDSLATLATQGRAKRQTATATI